MGSTDFEFVIPVSRDDLLRRTSLNQYCVDEVLSRSGIPSAVHEFIQSSRNNPFAAVDHFDTIFSVLTIRDLDSDLVEETWHTLIKVCRGFYSTLSRILEDFDIAIDTRVHHLNAMKMTTYLLCQFIEMYESQALQPGLITMKKGRKKMSKQQTKNGMDWDSDRETGVQVLVEILLLNLNKLWDPPIVEEDFVSMISSCLYKLLENPALASVRGKETRDIICHGIGVMVKRYNHTLSASLKIAQLLKHFEHLVSPLAQMVEVIVNEYGSKSIVGDIMREIGRMDPRDATHDTSGAKAYSQFLVELAEKVPTAMLPNISVVLTHLDGEAYTLRNGVLGMMGQILIKVLSKDGLDQHLKVTRDGFFDRLQDHIHDTNAFVRSKVLQIWLNIVSEKCLPLPRQEALVDLVLGRLQDKSSQVRRCAIQLLTAILRCNPFAAKLSVEELALNYEKEKTKLEDMTPEDGLSSAAERPIEELETEWDKISPLLIQALNDLENETDFNEGDIAVSIDEDDNIHSVMDKVYNFLMEEQYSSAIMLTNAAKKTWPDLDIFHGIDGGSEDISGTISSLKKVFFEHRSMDLAKITEVAATVHQNQHGACVEVNEVSKQQVLVQYLKDSLAFARQIQESVPIISQLLGSKNTSDVLESIEFFVTSYEFGLSVAIIGIRRMLVLIWSKEQGVKDIVVAAYKKLYLESCTGSQRAKALTVVKNLTQLIFGASCGDLTSLEALMIELMANGDITPQVIQVLWERFTLKIGGTTPQESRAALLLISMVAGAEADVVRSNLEVVIGEGLGPRAEKDWFLAQAACQAILKLASKKVKGQSATEPFRLSPDHHLFSRLCDLLVSGLSYYESRLWIPLSEQAVTLIYQLADQPDLLCGDLIHRVAARLLSECQAVSSSESNAGELNSRVSCLLTRLLSLAGQVALQQLVHMEVTVLGELKRRNTMQEDKQRKKTKTGGENIEEELGLAGATADDAEIEYIRRLCEKEVVSGSNLLGALQPLMIAVCTNQSRYSQPELRTAATLSLAKLMAVSSEFCEQQLQLMFTIMEKSPSEVIRANSIIALGDLTFRFPNLTEPWTPHLYSRLRDESQLVRKYTLQVLTHLILNDMVKVKGQISEMANCIVDVDDKISGLAKLFFHELAKKGNALYNVLPDAISRLSDPDVGIDEESFHIIMKYLFSFIEKDKLCESLVEKLCHRYRATRNERQWRDLSFCLSLLSYNEKSLRKLQENFACFADKLVDEAVYSCFTTIISKSRSGFVKPEAKVLVDELEERLEQCHKKGLDEDETAQRASKVSAAASQQTKSKSRKTPALHSKAKTGRSRMKGKENIVTEVPETPVRKSMRSRRNQPKPKFDFGSDTDEEFLAEEGNDSACFNATSPVPGRTKGGRVPLGRKI